MLPEHRISLFYWIAGSFVAVALMGIAFLVANEAHTFSLVCVIGGGFGALFFFAGAIWLSIKASAQQTAPSRGATPVPDWPIRDLFAHINPDFLSRTDDEVGDAWDKAGNEIRDQASLGRLKIWGRVVRDGPDRILGQRQALRLIEPSYWTMAFFTYTFFDNTSGDAPHTYLEAGRSGAEYSDLQVNRAEALSIWPSSRHALQIILGTGGDFENRKSQDFTKRRTHSA